MTQYPLATTITETIISHTVVLILYIANFDAIIISVQRTAIFQPAIGKITAIAKKATAFKKQP